MIRAVGSAMLGMELSVHVISLRTYPNGKKREKNSLMIRWNFPPKRKMCGRKREGYLVLQKLRVLHQAVVKDEEVAQRCRDDVDEEAADNGQNVQRQHLAPNVVGCPRRRVDVGREEMLIRKVEHQIHAAGKTGKGKRISEAR